MNVLAAPFLYTMPSEIEAFYCFAKFIEEACPLYVQPTLEGVHRGLRVRTSIIFDLILFSSSYSTDVWSMLIQSYLRTFVPRICQPNCTHLLVSRHFAVRIA